MLEGSVTDATAATVQARHALACRPQHAVTISSPTTGISLEVDTTSPGLQFYSGGLLSAEVPVTGKGGIEYPQFGGFAVETQVLSVTQSNRYPLISLTKCMWYSF